MSQLPAPPSIADGFTTDDVVSWVAEHLGDLTLERPDGIAAGGIRGGQSAADMALAVWTSPATPATAALSFLRIVVEPVECRRTSGTVCSLSLRCGTP